MAYYDENGGDSFGRFNKNFDGPVGPRRPSMFDLYVISSLGPAVCRLTDTLRTQDW